MDKQQWLAIFDAELKQHYAITIEDSGWERDELYDRWGDIDPSCAVDQFGDKYGLRPVKGKLA